MDAMRFVQWTRPCHELWKSTIIQRFWGKYRGADSYDGYVIQFNDSNVIVYSGVRFACSMCKIYSPKELGGHRLRWHASE